MHFGIQRGSDTQHSCHCQLVAILLMKYWTSYFIPSSWKHVSVKCSSFPALNHSFQFFLELLTTFTAIPTLLIPKHNRHHFIGKMRLFECLRTDRWRMLPDAWSIFAFCCSSYSVFPWTQLFVNTYAYFFTIANFVTILRLYTHQFL